MGSDELNLKSPLNKERQKCLRQDSLLRCYQSQILREDILEIVTAPLPCDPKLAMAEVQRRRLECDHKDKYVRQLAPSGLRDRAEDQQQKGVTGGKITISWES